MVPNQIPTILSGFFILKCQLNLIETGTKLCIARYFLEAILAKVSYSCLFEGVRGGRQGWEVESRGGTWGDKAGIRARVKARVGVRVRVGLGLGPPP